MERVALKEWAVAVRAMEAGQQNVILRKGGIQEAEGDFQLKHNEFLLYPAREHQKAEYLEPQFIPLLDQTQAEQRGDIVVIRSRAKVVRYQLVHAAEDIDRINGRHIWNRKFIEMRLDYKPDRPLYVIELEISPLEKPLEFVETTAYAGCKSWVYLDEHHAEP